MRACLALCGLEAMESEQDLLRGNSDKLSTATGFVLGGLLSGVLWSAIYLVTWSLVA